MNNTMKILQGDCLEMLKTMPDNSVDCLVTSPPYWALRDYGTANWEGGDNECKHEPDKTSPTSTLGGGKATQGSAKFYKEMCPKCGAKRIDRQLGLEPTFQEYITKLCDIFDEVKRVLKDEGTCWVNIGDTYSSKPAGNVDIERYLEKAGTGNTKSGEQLKAQKNKAQSGLPDKCLVCIPDRFKIEMINRGWICRNEIIWHKPNCMPSSVKDRFTVDYEKVFFFVKQKKYFFKTQLEPTVTEYSPERAVRPETSKMKAIHSSGKPAGNFTTNKIRPEGRNKRCVWQVNTKPYKEAHFATYPEKLIEPMIDAGCPVGGVVLDPFFGAGTTGVVAKKQKKDCIGIELNPEYIEIAKARNNQVDN